jgi:hypothetical protein
MENSNKTEKNSPAEGFWSHAKKTRMRGQIVNWANFSLFCYLAALIAWCRMGAPLAVLP